VSNTLMSEVQTQDRKRKRAEDDDPQSDQTTRVSVGTVAPAQTRQNAASTGTSVPTAVAPTTSIVPVPTNPKRARTVDNVVKPTRYGRSLYWEGSVDGVSRLAHISESLRPLPSVPDDELQNNIVTKTISDNEHLFSIVTPINIDRLAALLVNHPNPPFVTSVLRGLREGFWPWADTQHEIYPMTKDYFKPREYEEHIKQFL
jgi:hypothetical protein